MTSEEIILAGSGDNAQWLKEIAYQLAVINESAGNYLADQKERRRKFDAVREAQDLKMEQIRALNREADERYLQELADKEVKRTKTE